MEENAGKYGPLHVFLNVCMQHFDLVIIDVGSLLLLVSARRC